jgi:hypothetical protein
MSYLTEAFEFIVPTHNYHTNNAYMVIGNEYQIDRINRDELTECGTSYCSPAVQPVGLPQYAGQTISPTVSCNDFQQLPSVGCNSDFYRQRSRGPSDTIYTSSGPDKFCSKMNTCENFKPWSYTTQKCCKHF